MNFALEKFWQRESTAIRSLILRFISALILIPAVLAAVHVGERFFPALVAFANVVMIFEWTRMVERREFSVGFYALAAGATAALFAGAAGAYEAAYAICAFSGAGAFALARRAGGLGLWPALAAPYIIAPSIALIWLRLDADHGRSLTLMLFMIVWAADTGAFITGKLIGGPKISYALSPSKTWAGIGGGVAGGAVLGASCAIYFWGPGAGLPFFMAGGVLGAASVLGDLTESAFKRYFGVKNISSFIPGHGGALDRLDGMIFAAIAMTSAVFLYMLAAH